MATMLPRWRRWQGGQIRQPPSSGLSDPTAPSSGPTGSSLRAISSDPLHLLHCTGSTSSA
ncbi:hypothetical protein E2562_006774 [Oryza meyeriana var. granulata]|uniref:Uncharacterized protein n=1 Tax=Oryza meyeriana var. granulata TaxID=110450 RepID=A0A6G1C497_9ORYZ|nr:hypothetical protein E2562_006774 [Oryza meyeriana var. granulata]